jgi:CHAT domain-containing protein
MLECDEAAHTIASLCLDPVRAFLADKTRVLVVPHQSMWSVPLALVGAEPLALTHSVSYVPSLSTAAMLLTAPPHRHRVERFVGIADPDASLPGAKAEVENAAKHFYDRCLLTGAAVQRDRVLAYLRDADVIHFACHGGFFTDYPELSWLQLGADPGAIPLLLAEDLVQMALRARLVVLAACHAGNATVLPGAEYVGLPAAFLVAGAATTLAPLWEVDDQATSELMAAFYEELQANPPSAALWRAQLRARARPSTAHPYNWAAFQLYGLP